MYCGNCGHRMNEGDLFCPECGTRVEDMPKAYDPPVSVKHNRTSYRRLFIIVTSLVLIAVLGAVFIPKLTGRRSGSAEPTTVKSEYGYIMDAEIGDTVKFGSYEQDNDLSNGKEDIEWIVLDKTDGKVMLISRYALDAKAYNDDYTSVTWENCTLRRWMNDVFYNEAFRTREQEMICETKVTADSNPSFGTYPGNDTYDRVFLLSAGEAQRYLEGKDIIICAPTPYALAQGGWRSPDNGNCWWWLRSPGNRTSRATDVYSVGTISLTGGDVHVPDACVRPVIWIEF